MFIKYNTDNWVQRIKYNENESGCLEKLEDEFYLQYLNGEATDADFDAYVEQWNSLGGADITAELTEMMAE